MILLHMGALHPFEKVVTLVLAFGPFLVLAAVILVRRRQGRAQDRAQDRAQEQASQDPQRDR